MAEPILLPCPVEEREGRGNTGEVAGDGYRFLLQDSLGNRPIRFTIERVARK